MRFPERQKVTRRDALEDSKTDSACKANSTQLPVLVKSQVKKKIPKFFAGNPAVFSAGFQLILYFKAGNPANH